jgi:hypothetical protein
MLSLDSPTSTKGTSECLEHTSECSIVLNSTKTMQPLMEESDMMMEVATEMEKMFLVTHKPSLLEQLKRPQSEPSDDGDEDDEELSSK